MSNTCIRLILLVALLNGSALSWAATEIIFSDSSVCDFHDLVCANVRITFDINEKVMEIHGRVYRAHGKGVLTFYLNGITPINEQISHPVTIEVKGHYNEIIRAKFQPPLSNQTEWSLQEVVFDPEPKQ